MTSGLIRESLVGPREENEATSSGVLVSRAPTVIAFLALAGDPTVLTPLASALPAVIASTW